jgi:predicted lipid-binding transport protein (Tim44 family)
MIRGKVRVSLIAVLVAAVAGLLEAAPAFALGGGGSAGFSGGGGGFSGGGGGGFGGGYYGGSGGSGHISGGVVAVIVIAIIVIVIGSWLYARMLVLARRHHIHEREKRVRTASAVAAEDDAAFDSDTVHAQAAQLFMDIQSAWDAQDRKRLREMVGPELWVEWKRRLDDFDRKGWHNRVQPLGPPKITYVGLHNAADPNDDRVVVIVEARVRDYVETSYGRHITHQGSSSEIINASEYWTLGKHEVPGTDGEYRWILISIQQAKEGDHELSEEMVVTPDADETAMRDEALVEGAAEDAVPEGVKIAEVADLDYEGDARAAANDLSLADGRFAPDILEVAARRAVGAWAQAIDGDRGDLEAIADHGVVGELLHPGDPSGKTRLVVRGPRVREIRIMKLDAQSEPPSMQLEVKLEGRRYIEDRDTTAIVSGSQSNPRQFTEHWTMGLTDDKEQPWRIIAVGAPARA